MAEKNDEMYEGWIKDHNLADKDMDEAQKLIQFKKAMMDLSHKCTIHEMEHDAGLNDNVEHPDHYCAGRRYEPKDVIRDWGLNFNLGNAVKYISRAGRKPGNSQLQDLEKAREYLTFEIEYLQNKQDETLEGRRPWSTVLNR